MSADGKCLLGLKHIGDKGLSNYLLSPNCGRNVHMSWETAQQKHIYRILVNSFELQILTAQEVKKKKISIGWAYML